MRKSERPFMVEFSGTPEAGKTTSILTVSKMLENAGYTTEILRESAESLPDEIPKGTFHANMWMHFITQAGILKATYSKADVVLIDRGIIDSQFYGSSAIYLTNIVEEPFVLINQSYIFHT